MSGAALPFADLALARRLERAEAASSARYVEARARLFPASGACWIEVAGAYAMFDGIASPVTQTFGLGMFQAPTAGDLERLEAFFHARGAPAYHEVSPLADPALVPLLNERGYRPFEFTSVHVPPDCVGRRRLDARSACAAARRGRAGALRARRRGRMA